MSVVETMFTQPCFKRIQGYTNVTTDITKEPIAIGSVKLRSENRDVIKDVTMDIAINNLNRPGEHLIEQFAHSSGYISGSFIPRKFLIAVTTALGTNSMEIS